MLPVEELITTLNDCTIAQDQTPNDVSVFLKPLISKLAESSRSDVKRSKDRCLEEAVQLLRKIPGGQLHLLEESRLHLLVQLLISMQLEMVNISTACRKLDQMLQHLSEVNRPLVFRETQLCLHAMLHSDQMLSVEDLQKACMFLEDSACGREVWRESCQSLLGMVAQMFPVILQQEGLRNGPMCYLTIKVCLQIFQLLPGEVSPLVWGGDQGSPSLQTVLQALMDIILGQSSNRDTRLLAGTAVAMLVNTAPENGSGGAAAWSLLQVSHSGPWLLTVGCLQVQCSPVSQDGVDRLSVSRGLLTCSRPQILLCCDAHNNTEKCLLLDGLFPLVSALCEKKLDCHYYVFEVLTLWLRKVKDSLADIWRVKVGRLLPDDCSLQQHLTKVIWNNAESPVEGVSDLVHSAFCLLLEIYEMDCERFADTKKTLHRDLMNRVTNLPWEAKAKYSPLCALLPYLGTEVVMDRYAELPNHLLKCLSTNHLSPCAAELYRYLLRQQRKELCEVSQQQPPELDLAKAWARRWRSPLTEALTSEVTLVQSNASSHLLPCTLQIFPAAVEPLLASLDPGALGHLHAWACVMSARRATTGGSPWISLGGSAPETLRLALGSVDEKVRLAAVNLLCCSPKTKEAPTAEELSYMKTFIPQNLNSESSPFRQHFQAAVRRFLVRIRDSCLPHLRGQKGKKNAKSSVAAETEKILEQGVGFVDWLGELPYIYLAPGHSYQRKKTVLLLLCAVLETCTDTWSPDKKKGQPPVNMASLIHWARQKGKWNFFSRCKQLALISCLEDSTNEIRELSAGLLVRFFPPALPDDVTPVLFTRTQQLLCSPRVPEAEMGALMMKLLLQKSQGQPEVPWLMSGDNTGSGSGDSETTSMVRYLVKELEQHYLTAQADMMLAARTKPIHGILGALERCLLDVPGSLADVLDRGLTIELLDLLEKTSQLLLRVLHGSQDSGADKDVAPSFCDMGNAISSLIAQAAREGPGEGEECVLLSEEHSLVLTCCWVSLKAIGIFLGSLVERILAESKSNVSLLTADDLRRASKVFRDILLKCRHWGAVEGCCVGFIKFCASLLGSSNPELRDIPPHMLLQGLQVLRSPRCASVTRRAAGLPMLILCVVSAEEASKCRPLLAQSIHALLDTANAPLPQHWDQTLDLPQVCAVHTLQALVRGSRLGTAILQFAPAVALLSLTLLNSPCWAMRNAALQLYSSLCTRMLGQRSADDEGSSQCGMSPSAFFSHYPALQPFLLGELRGAAEDLQGPSGEARLRLHPSLYPVLTLLAKLLPGTPDLTGALSAFRAPLLRLASSPICSVRAMASKALVAMTPPSEFWDVLVQLTDELPGSQDPCCHNQLHGRLLQIKAILDRAVGTDSVQSVELCEVVRRVEAVLWLGTGAQRCPLVRAAYVGVVGSLRHFCSEAFLSELCSTLLSELYTQHHRLQVGSSSFHQAAIRFLCAEEKWAHQIWEGFSTASPDVKLPLVAWVVDGRGLKGSGLLQLAQKVLQSNLRAALASQNVEYRGIYLAALVAVMTAGEEPAAAHHLHQCPPGEDVALSECLDLLLGDMEAQRGGPERLSQALCAASLLLPPSPESSSFQRWCSLLEVHCHPEAPEALRMACGWALCLAGAPLMSQALRRHAPFPDVSTRLINTGLYLLQDESQEVRMKAACFASALLHARRGGQQKNAYVMQVNQALPFLLDLLLEECWDDPEVLGVLLSHLPESNLRSVLEEATQTGCASLYEQDEANVFAEPAVMSACLLPYLLQMAGKCSDSAALRERLNLWARENVAQVLDGLAVCKGLHTGESLSPTWLALLMAPHFHGSVCGLLTRATFLLRLLDTASSGAELPCDPATLLEDVREVHAALAQNGVKLPAAFTDTAAAHRPV